MKTCLAFLFALLALICAIQSSSAAAIAARYSQEDLQQLVDYDEEDNLPENKLLQAIDEDEEDDEAEGLDEKDLSYVDDNDHGDDDEGYALVKYNTQNDVLDSENDDNKANKLKEVEGRDILLIRRRHHGRRRGNRRRRRGRRNRRRNRRNRRARRNRRRRNRFG